MTNKMYKVVGTSIRNGKMKVRWAKDIIRCKVLQHTENTEIEMYELPTAMYKTDAVRFMLDTYGEKMSPERKRAAKDALATRSSATAEDVVKAVA